MNNEEQNNEEQETTSPQGGSQSQDELEGLTTESIEGVQLPETVKVGEEDVSTQTLIDTYVNKHKWSKAATERDQELSESRKRLEENQRQIEQRETDLRSWEMGMYQQRTQPSLLEPTNGQPAINLEEFDDPAIKTIYQELQGMKQTQSQWQENYQREQFALKTQAEHQRLQSQYSDYNPIQIERSIIQGRNMYEDAYKAEKYNNIKMGDKESIRGIIPEDLLKEIQVEERKRVIDDLRNREQKRKAIATPQPSKTALPVIPKGRAKNYLEVKEDILSGLSEEGTSLTI